MSAKGLLSTTLTLLAAAGAPAQNAYSFNGLEHTNWWLTAREDPFPNFHSPTGNVAGDGLFKVVPRSLLQRAGDHHITGYRLAIAVESTYPANFYPASVRLPGIQLYRTTFL